MKDDEFQCSNCGGVFRKGWSDEEAAADRDQRYKGFEPEELRLVCEHCYKTIFAEILQ